MQFWPILWKEKDFDARLSRILEPFDMFCNLFCSGWKQKRRKNDSAQQRSNYMNLISYHIDDLLQKMQKKKKVK
jgi:hypothetical protein